LESRGWDLARRGGGKVMVREVLHEPTGGGSGTSLSFPMLTRTNYTHCMMVMEVNLQAASLWDAIEFDYVLRRDDKQALAALVRTTSDAQRCHAHGRPCLPQRRAGHHHVVTSCGACASSTRGFIL
jgi:hypothetical protein